MFSSIKDFFVDKEDQQSIGESATYLTLADQRKEMKPTIGKQPGKPVAPVKTTPIALNKKPPVAPAKKTTPIANGKPVTPIARGYKKGGVVRKGKK